MILLSKMVKTLFRDKAHNCQVPPPPPPLPHSSPPAPSTPSPKHPQTLQRRIKHPVPTQANRNWWVQRRSLQRQVVLRQLVFLGVHQRSPAEVISIICAVLAGTVIATLGSHESRYVRKFARRPLSCCCLNQSCLPIAP